MAFGVGPKTVFLKWAFATALVITNALATINVPVNTNVVVTINAVAIINALGMVRMAHLTLAQGRLVTKSTKQKLTTKT